MTQRSRQNFESQDDGMRPSARRNHAYSNADAASASGRNASRGSSSFSARLERANAAGGNRTPRGRRRGPGAVRKFIYAWFDRITGAVGQGGFSAQEEEYESHRTSRDYVWNTAGFASWGMVFPLLTIIVTQLVGVEQAGMFSLAFVAATLLYFLGIYGVRTYQVSDIDSMHSFKDYQVQRVLTCIIMVALGYLYCLVRGYTDSMLAMSMWVYAFKAIDALGEVYEGRLQQKDKLYLAGISLTIRSVASLVIFTIALLITRDLVISSAAMAVAAAITFAIVTFPLTLLETPPSAPLSIPSVLVLFKQCFPLFIALFMFNLVDNIPKFLMEGVLTYDNQLYFNAMYFPAQAVLIIAGFIYKPLLVRMANTWADRSRRKKFDLFIVAMSAIIVAITVVAILVAAWIGIPVMNFLYGLDFEDYRLLFFIMIAAGGLTAVIDFFYQVITILRRQKVVTELYLVTFVFSVVVLLIMIQVSGLDGAVLGYLVSMAILFILLLREYISVRIEFARHPEEEATEALRVIDDQETVLAVSGQDARYGMYERSQQVSQALRTSQGAPKEAAAGSRRSFLRRNR